RSWNRAYVRYMYTTPLGSNHYIKLGTKVWAVLNKAAENENIRREFLGSYHLTASYWSSDQSHFELFFRPGKNGRDAMELNISQPIPCVSNSNFNMYFSYFKGFGESLVSYNQETESVHIGVIVNHSIF
ncbi:MAG: hypothetical protein GQ553_02780, partial [Nitrosomonadaceae bacterium]|nr:hypothetical protein [Nitrosomonadaceae bacterium]